MTDRARQLAIAEGYNDLEQLPPASPALRDLLDRWARGEASEADLLDAEQRILARQAADPAGPGAPPAPRAA